MITLCSCSDPFSMPARVIYEYRLVSLSSSALLCPQYPLSCCMCLLVCVLLVFKTSQNALSGLLTVLLTASHICLGKFAFPCVDRLPRFDCQCSRTAMGGWNGCMECRNSTVQRFRRNQAAPTILLVISLQQVLGRHYFYLSDTQSILCIARINLLSLIASSWCVQPL